MVLLAIQDRSAWIIVEESARATKGMGYCVWLVSTYKLVQRRKRNSTEKHMYFIIILSATLATATIAGEAA